MATRFRIEWQTNQWMVGETDVFVFPSRVQAEETMKKEQKSHPGMTFRIVEIAGGR